MGFTQSAVGKSRAPRACAAAQRGLSQPIPQTRTGKAIPLKCSWLACARSFRNDHRNRLCRSLWSLHRKRHLNLIAARRIEQAAGVHEMFIQENAAAG